MPSHIDISLLRTFISVVENGSFTVAAERLLRTQPAVSLQIKRLEETVGAKLLTRHRDHVSLTRKGQLIMNHARAVLDASDNLLRAAAESERGSVQIILSELAASILMEDILGWFKLEVDGNDPMIRICSPKQLQQSITSYELDLAIYESEGSSREEISLQEDVMWSCSPDYPTSRPVLILPPKGTLLRKSASDVIEKASLKWFAKIESETLLGSSDLARRGFGIAALPVPLVDSNLIPAQGLPEIPPIRLAVMSHPNGRGIARKLKTWLAGSTASSRSRIAPTV